MKIFEYDIVAHKTKFRCKKVLITKSLEQNKSSYQEIMKPDRSYCIMHVKQENWDLAEDQIPAACQTTHPLNQKSNSKDTSGSNWDLAEAQITWLSMLRYIHPR